MKRLTATERLILRRLRDGESLSRVATDLGRSLLTIRTHVRNARAKLEIRSSNELWRRLEARELDDEIAEPG